MTFINLTSGFDIVEADDRSMLDQIRADIYEHVANIYNVRESSPERGLNEFHKAIKNLSLGEINERRIELIRRITSECAVGERVFLAFEKKILSILGPDILAQRNCNLVLQPPEDPYPSELHRDTPGNSAYEIVVWIPLVDCYGSKAMYILDKVNTQTAMEWLDAHPNDWPAYEKYARSLAINPNVSFGQALIFHTGCLHGSDVNVEGETRVSLNMRYKNIFSPSGLKNQLQFFKPLRISDLTRIGSELEARELMK